jgi:hypothetical protein
MRPITPEGTNKGWISSDGRAVLAQTGDGSYGIFPIDGSASQRVAALTDADEVARWSPDGKALWLTRTNEFPLRVERLELATGRRTLLTSGARSTLLGQIALTELTLADDGQSFAYVGREYVSHIFEVRGMR